MAKHGTTLPISVLVPQERQDEPGIFDWVPKKKVNYADECENDAHDPGCTCGAPHYFTTLAEAKEKAADPYRPAEPNKLYFKRLCPATPNDTLVHYWELTDSEGVRIAVSHDLHHTKSEAITNSFTIFGKEILAGYHKVVDQTDYKLVLNHAAWLEQVATDTVDA